MPDTVSTLHMLTIVITVRTVMREKPETAQKTKEGFAVEVIFKCGLERTIRMKL